MKKRMTGNSKMLMNVLLGVALFLAGCSTSRNIISDASVEELAQSIQNDQWVFVAEQVMPQYGPSRQITGVYEVNCHGDTADVYLPYYGRSYTAELPGIHGPLDFSSRAVQLNKEELSSDNWQVTLKPSDQKEVRSMHFTFYDNGEAALNVQMTNKSSISFRGTIRPRRIAQTG